MKFPFVSRVRLDALSEICAQRMTEICRLEQERAKLAGRVTVLRKALRTPTRSQKKFLPIIQSLITEYEMKLENAERYGHGDELIYEDMIKKLKELVG